MVICFPRGLICKDSNEAIIKSGNLRLNIADENETQNYSDPTTVIDQWQKGDYQDVSSFLNKVTTAKVSSLSMYLFSSVSLAPSSDYNQSKPSEIGGFDSHSNFLDVAVLRDYGAIRFYPDYNDKSFYVKATFTTSTWGANVVYAYYRNGSVIKSLGSTAINGTSSYNSGPYRGQAVSYSLIPWKSYITGSFKIGRSRITTIAKYWLDDSIANGFTYAVGESLTSEINWWDSWIGDFEPVIPDDDNPYWDGGTSTEGKGDSNFSELSDTIELDTLPTIDAIGSGFATLFTPSKSQLIALADIMWNNNIFSALQNLVENITNMFTGLSIVPFTVEAGSTVEVTWFGLAITEVYLTLAAKQYYEIDMGSIDLGGDDRIFTSGSALDYAPYSKLGIYLPFIGFQELDVDECRGCVMGLKYRIDILSGTAVAIISLNGNNIYQYSGNCLTQIPITSESLESAISDAVSVGIAISNTGATAATAAGEIAESASSTDGLKFDDIANAHRKITSSEGQLASATANAAMGMKPTIKKSGAVSAAASLLSVRQPYLFLTTPRQSLPEHYQKYCGFPSNITGKLNTFSGFTVVESIRLNGLVATSPEVAEIYDLLKKGVII